jgi:DHA1 family bicyclomycin/chloramphenicol resistance-like MFS transporter
MALAMPILSLAALDRHPKIRGTAASGQAFIQMLLSTVSAGLVVPLFGMRHQVWRLLWLYI